MTESRILINTVIKNDFCIGCGACSIAEDSPFLMQFNEFGNIVPLAKYNPDKTTAKVLSICPFSGISKNEAELSAIFLKEASFSDSKIGRYLTTFAGYVKEGSFRDEGSSGGILKWLGYTLLKEGEIDYFVQLFPNSTQDSSKPLFEYKILSQANEIIYGAKSAYYPVTLDNIIKLIKEKEGSYAITGIPCFSKAIRLLSLQDKILGDRIKYIFGIFCGGMKSANQSKMIAWQLGVHPTDLISIDFRRKHKEKPASKKIYQVWSNKDSIERYAFSEDLFGTGWNGYFKPTACDFCDDIVSETADISVGDAWLPKYVKDPKGTSLLIIRNKTINNIIFKYKEKDKIFLEPISPENVAASQAGGFRQRREALSFRVKKKEKKNLWYPPKRVKAKDFNITNKRKRIYNMREKIANQSHISFLEALKKDDLNIFFKALKPIEKKYNRIIYGGILVRFFRKIFRN